MARGSKAGAGGLQGRGASRCSYVRATCKCHLARKQARQRRVAV